MTHVFHRHCHSNLPTAATGDGPYIIDTQGKRYLDGSSGAAVSSLGHNHPAIISAIKKQLQSIPYAHSGFFTSEPAEELAQWLTDKAPGDLNRVYYTSGGSEAVEAALKMARQYFLEQGESQRQYFIARRQSYHGNTLGALAVGGNQWRRQQFDPLLSPVQHIAPCYSYRDQRTDETEAEYGLRIANELEQALLTTGPEKVLAFIAEPVVGATSGAVPAVPGYLKRVREICDQYGILLILDEVMCGMGRTGSLFACEQDDVVPDIITVAKGLGAGYQPIGAVLVREQLYQAFAQGSGFFQHGHTYMAHPTACAAALAVQHTIEQDQLLSRVRKLNKQITGNLNEMFNEHPYVGDIRGRGLLLGIELVADRETKQPLPAGSNIHQLIKQCAMQRGLMCYPMAGTIDGKQGHHILLAPPFILTNTQADELTDKLQLSLQDAFQELDK
ncbi:aspartate aminotransferase family protein [Amphritea balenae]|uniref:Aspartate aminotransferase family protein n=1 Tax=Amphritea balenae TaxID=452629 RepID=A0A3P1SRJ3_9GAMM|nr:aspartate aminotransferase family protein [Amphritea balenae]RRC99659.1 aspartate aminotransferase family protein [Amphritea balenae]GGK78743.1 aspartate aminotransferase family protein [Amphritea balenae]